MTNWKASGFGAFPNGDQTRMEPEPGMSLRDWFAGQVLANPKLSYEMAGVANTAYSIADDMLETRKK